MSTQPQEHPSWCSPIWCTAGQTGGAHRSAPVVFATSVVEIELGLHRDEGSITYPADVFATVSVYDPLRGSMLTTDGFHFTLALDDARRLADMLGKLLERAR